MIIFETNLQNFKGNQSNRREYFTLYRFYTELITFGEGSSL